MKAKNRQGKWQMHYMKINVLLKQVSCLSLLLQNNNQFSFMLSSRENQEIIKVGFKGQIYG